ncbi:polyamine ABC transporter substrate-binding protein [Aliamphritea ceti]|uniref:polyamine ABC transporter substrate-binding protein n=1 Tax=Aliamphritea ceti TaxID=1524258 RepID=UPI0021C43E00|nr:spermidine/putrescine ABC transporter substrate-binding protein [Aliamphritea ceti]
MRLSITSVSLIMAITLPAQADTLRLLNWDAYLGTNAISQWQEQGHRIESVLIDNDETRDAVLLNSVDNQIDLAVIDETVSNRFGKEGRLVKVDETNVPSLANVEPFWRERCGNYAVPYLWGTLGIAYRSDIISKAPTSWKDLLEPSEALKGHISMMNDHIDMLAPALFAQGFSLNSETESELKQAFSALRRQASHVLTYEYPITYLGNSPNSDQLHMGMVYGGDQFTMNKKAGKENLWKYAVPEEGTVLWVDCLAVTSTSKNQALALKFMDFINQPDIAAKNAEELFFATPNAAAKKLLPAKFRDNPEVFPANEIINRSQLYRELSNPTIKLRLRITNAVVNIYESGKTH